MLQSICNIALTIPSIAWAIFPRYINMLRYKVSRDIWYTAIYCHKSAIYDILGTFMYIALYRLYFQDSRMLLYGKKCVYM